MVTEDDGKTVNAVLLPYFRNSTAKIRAKIEIPSAVKQKYRFKNLCFIIST